MIEMLVGGCCLEAAIFRFSIALHRFQQGAYDTVFDFPKSQKIASVFPRLTTYLKLLHYYIINVSTERHFALQNKYFNVDLLDCEPFCCKLYPSVIVVGQRIIMHVLYLFGVDVVY